MLALVIILSVDGLLLVALLIRQETINHKIKHMAENQDQLAQEILAAAAQTRKAVDEILAKIKSLQDAINAGTVSQAVKDAMAQLQGAAQAADDIVPDAPTP